MGFTSNDINLSKFSALNTLFHHQNNFDYSRIIPKLPLIALLCSDKQRVKHFVECRASRTQYNERKESKLLNDNSTIRDLYAIIKLHRKK